MLFGCKYTKYIWNSKREGRFLAEIVCSQEKLCKFAALIDE